MLLLVAICLVAPAQTAPSTALEILVLPVEPVKLPQERGLEAWRAVSEELAKAKDELGLGVGLHAAAQSALLSAKQQAFDCQGDAACLAAIGQGAGADLVVFGRIGKRDVELVAIAVHKKASLVTARSNANLAGKSVLRRASGAPEPPSPPSPPEVEETSPPASPAPPLGVTALTEAPAATRVAAPEEEGDHRAPPWWVFVSAIAAVGAGTATALLLIGGGKGGPSVEGEQGSIQGTY